MKLKNVKITNFKGVEDFDIDFTGNFNLIIGNNGSGKTSILDAISVGLGAYTAGVEGIYGKHFKKDDVRIYTKEFGDASLDIIPVVPVTVGISLELNEHNFTWERRKKSLLSSRTTIEPNDISRFADQMVRDEYSILPLINYQGASRMWSDKRNNLKKDFKHIPRSFGYLNTLSPESNTKMLVDWCKRMEQISWQKKKLISEYESVKKAISQFMGLMSNSEIDEVFYDTQHEKIMYREGNDVLPISYLSAGYQSLIWMVFDIAFRMAVLNPHQGNNIMKKTPGLVLIDEIDVHLHPKWQWNVINALKSTFPKVQFIATTHSPIILSSCKDTVIQINDSGTIEYLDNLYSQPLVAILDDYQEALLVPEEIDKEFTLINNLLEEKEYNMVEKKLEILEKKIGENNPKIHKIRLDLEFDKLDFDKEFEI